MEHVFNPILGRQRAADPWIQGQFQTSRATQKNRLKEAKQTKAAARHGEHLKDKGMVAGSLRSSSATGELQANRARV